MVLDSRPKQLQITAKVRVQLFYPFIGKVNTGLEYEVHLYTGIGAGYSAEHRYKSFWIAVLGFGIGVYYHDKREV